MKRDFFNKWHRDALQQHRTEVDVDALWAAIEPEVDAINVKRKKRRGFLFFLSCFCFGIIGIGFIGLFTHTSPQAAQHISTSTNTYTNDIKQGTQIDALNIEETINPVDNTVKPNLFSESKTTRSSSIITSRDIISPIKTEKNGNFQENTRKHGRSISASEVRLTEKSNTTYMDLDGLNNPNSLQTTPTLQQNKSAIHSVISVADKKEVLPSANAIPLLATTAISPTPQDEDLNTVAIQIPKPSPFQFSIGIYTGLAIVNRSLTNTQSSDGSELLILREGTEKSLELWNNGIQAKLKHKSGLSLGVGIQYARLAERIQYKKSHLLLNTIANQVIGYSNNLFGDRSEIIGNAPNNTIHDLEYDFYNNYHFVDIPVTIAYQKQIARWSLGARLSYIQNISLRTKGRILSSSYEVLNLEEAGDSVFKTNLGTSFEGGLIAGYRLTPHLEMGLDAYYRHIPNTITVADYALDQKYNWVGLNASLNYFF